MEDKDSKPFLLIHLILGASAYATIKTTESLRSIPSRFTRRASVGED